MKKLGLERTVEKLIEHLYRDKRLLQVDGLYRPRRLAPEAEAAVLDLTAGGS